MNVKRDLHCAEFVGGDKKTTITYGFTPKQIERLIEKVLEFSRAGGAFLPHGSRQESLRAELNGETLTFSAEAAEHLLEVGGERTYLLGLTVLRQYQVWATKFIPLKAMVDVRRVVEGLDMPVAYTEFRPPPPGSGPEAQVQSVPLEDITEALDKHRAFIILGEPGAGKTTTLQKLAYEKANARLNGETAPVPLFVRLSQQKGRSPREFLQAEWKKHVGGDFDRALRGGDLLLLADGVNELPRVDRDERLKDWRVFVNDELGANQIVFTSRERGEYDQQLNLPRVRVEPLDGPRILDYLKRNDAEGLAELLADPQSRLGEMARNPFNLSLLVLAYKSNQREMGNRGRLLEWFTGELFAREERLAHKGWIHREAQTQALAQLAYAMQAKGESTTFAVADAKANLPAAVEVEGEDLAIQPTDLLRFARAATILDPATAPDVRFYHHLLQEYFAALELRRRFLAGDDPSTNSGQALRSLWVCKRRADEMPPSDVGEWDPLPEPPPTGWEVTTLLACGLAEDPARLIEAVRPHNPVLAGRCLVESGALQSAIENQKSSIQQDLLADLYNPALHLRARLQAGNTLGRVGDPRFAPQLINGVTVIVPQMIDVPAGTYPMGSAADEPDSFDDEKPQHTVDLPAFALGKWPVTNAEYACFMDAGGYKDEQWWKTDLAKRWLKGEDVAGGQSKAVRAIWEFMRENANWKDLLTDSYSPDQITGLEAIATLDEDGLRTMLTQNMASKSRSRPQWWDDADRNNPSQPVVGITWFEANAYCEWLSTITSRVYRLPSEAQWEAAARGLPSPMSGEGLGVRVYPWGDEWLSGKANTIEGRVMKPSPVGAYTAAGNVGPFGGEDQSGNVWNWTSSLYLAYPYQAEASEQPEAEGERVLRGGSWSYGRRSARCAYRNGDVPVNFNNNVGFRLCSPGSYS